MRDLPRRGLLRHLATLPLIGVGMTLLGNPTAAAEPVTRDLLDSYDAWRFYERRFLRFERYGPKDRGGDLGHDGRFVIMDSETRQSFDYVGIANAGGRYHCTMEPAPSSRAAVVLAAVDSDWREGN